MHLNRSNATVSDSPKLFAVVAMACVRLSFSYTLNTNAPVNIEFSCAALELCLWGYSSWVLHLALLFTITIELPLSRG